MIEESRDLFQTLIAPQLEDLKGEINAFAAKIDAFEARFAAEIDALDAMVAAIEIMIPPVIDSLETNFDANNVVDAEIEA